MKKTDPKTIEALRAHAQANPDESYAKLAATFRMSLASIKRHCGDLGRGKNWRRGRTVATADATKFWSSVDRSPGGCWEWMGCRNSSGYGVVHFAGRSQGTHRVGYELSRGPIPDRMELDHTCHNRACCNPDHLEVVNRQENMERVRRRIADRVPRTPTDEATGSIEPDEPVEAASEFPTMPPLADGDTLSLGPITSVRSPSSTILMRMGASDASEADAPTKDPAVAEDANALEAQHAELDAAFPGWRDRVRRHRFFEVEVKDRTVFRLIAMSAAEAVALVAQKYGPSQVLWVEADGIPDGDELLDFEAGYRYRMSSPENREEDTAARGVAARTPGEEA